MAKDVRAVDDHEDDQGASPKEQLLAACVGNNLDLLHEILESKECTPELLNDSRNGTGDTAMHLAVKYGNYEILDTLLDQEGLEVDPLNVMDSNTPLHIAALYSSTDSHISLHMVEMLIDAGADARIRNRGKQKAVDLVDPRCTDIRESLSKAEFTSLNQDDLRRYADIDDDDEAGSGTASDSD